MVRYMIEGMSSAVGTMTAQPDEHTQVSRDPNPPVAESGWQEIEIAAIKKLVLASAALIADWSADCEVEDATIAKLLEAYNAIGSQRLLLSEVERELAPAPPHIADQRPELKP